MRPFLRVSPAITIVILFAAGACKKSKPADRPVDAVVPAGVPALDLAGTPQIIFQVFGDRENPRMMPIAAIVNSVMKPIGLTPANWKQLGAQYMAAGAKYPFYMEDGDPGELTITRDTAYSLPGCTAVKPMALVQLAFKKPPSDPTVEFLASSGPMVAPRPETGKLMTADDIAKLARSIGHLLGKKSRLSAAELDSLDFHARMVPTGASAAPTLLISFIDPNSGSARSGPYTSHIFALADSGATGYEATYAHVVKGDAKTVEFQRLVNHVDFNGDGTDELIVEAWKYGSDNDLVVLSFKAGRWQEVLRVTQDWCLDGPTARK